MFVNLINKLKQVKSKVNGNNTTDINNISSFSMLKIKISDLGLDQ